MNDLMYRLFGLIPRVRRERNKIRNLNLIVKMCRRGEEFARASLNAHLAEVQIIDLLHRRHLMAAAGHPMFVNKFYYYDRDHRLNLF